MFSYFYHLLHISLFREFNIGSMLSLFNFLLISMYLHFCSLLPSSPVLKCLLPVIFTDHARISCYSVSSFHLPKLSIYACVFFKLVCHLHDFSPSLTLKSVILLSNGVYNIRGKKRTMLKLLIATGQSFGFSVCWTLRSYPDLYSPTSRV